MKKSFTMHTTFDTNDPDSRIVCSHTNHFGDDEDVEYCSETIYMRCIPEYFLVYDYGDGDEGIEPLTEQQAVELIEELIDKK